MNTQDQMEERLWDYIDGLSSQGERSAIDELIAANTEWQRKYRELLQVHQLMNSSELDAPSMRFTKNVMEEITRAHVAPATRNYINKNIIRAIAGFFLTMITGFLVYCLGQFKWSGHSSSNLVEQYNIKTNLNAEIEKFNWGKVFNSAYTNIFLLVTVVLGLMLLDMYLQRKRQQNSHKEANP
jgi:hypothetical protein